MKTRNIVTLTILAALPATGATYADLSSGLVAHYTFDGNANDSSGYGNDGIVHGATLTTDRFGNANSAYHFDGVDDYVRVPDDPVLDGMNSLTLSVWVKTDRVDRMTEVINKYGHGPPHLDEAYNIGIDTGGQVAFQYATASKYVIKITNYAIPIGEWHHAVGVYTGTHGAIYIDSHLAALSRNDSDSAGWVNSIANDLLIGCGEEGGNLKNLFEGSIDDIRIYNRALTADEIHDLYVVPVPGAIFLGSIGFGLVGWLCGKYRYGFKR